jgi:hypothetical protein
MITTTAPQTGFDSEICFSDGTRTADGNCTRGLVYKAEDDLVYALGSWNITGTGGGGSGTVTSIAAGNGMDFSTITTTGTATMGTPGTLSSSSTNALTTTSHTHAIDSSGFPSGIEWSTPVNASVTVDTGSTYDLATSAASFDESYINAMHTNVLYRLSSTVTSIEMNDFDIRFVADSADMFQIYGSGSNGVVVNPSSRDVNFRVHGDNVNNIFVVDAGDDNIRIGSQMSFNETNGAQNITGVSNIISTNGGRIYHNGSHWRLIS